MLNPMDPAVRRYYISLPVDDDESLDALADVAERLKVKLWPDSNSPEERRRYNVFDRSKVHVTLWACDLFVSEDLLKERLKLFMHNNRGRFTDLRIRFDKLSYLAKTETRYIVACLDPECRQKLEGLKRGLEKTFRDLGKSLLDRDTCQLHCSIVAYTNLSEHSNLLKVLKHFRSSIADINAIHSKRLIVTSQWNLLACGTFHDGYVDFFQSQPSLFTTTLTNISNNNSGNINNNYYMHNNGRQSPIIVDTVEDNEDSLASRTVELFNFPVTPNDNPKKLLLAVARMVGYDLKASMILSCQRKSHPYPMKSTGRDQRPPDIIAVLDNQDVAEKFLKCVKTFWKNNHFMVLATAIDSSLPRTKIRVMPRLPDELKIIHRNAKRIQFERNFKYCWIDADKIFLRKDDISEIHPIATMSQLNLIEKGLDLQQYSCIGV